jgi:TRAP-type mannitol/chloroaromatic compound transport system substrate-binding protein
MRKALALKCLTGLHFGRKLKSQSKPKKRNAPLLLIPWLIHSYTREGFYLTCRSLKTLTNQKKVQMLTEETRTLKVISLKKALLKLSKLGKRTKSPRTKYLRKRCLKIKESSEILKSFQSSKKEPLRTQN